MRVFLTLYCNLILLAYILSSLSIYRFVPITRRCFICMYIYVHVAKCVYIDTRRAWHSLRSSIENLASTRKGCTGIPRRSCSPPALFFNNYRILYTNTFTHTITNTSVFTLSMYKSIETLFLLSHLILRSKPSIYPADFSAITCILCLWANCTYD